MAAQWTRLLTQLISLVVLSRLLPSAVFGLVAMVTAVVGVASVLGDFGLSLSAITSRSVDHDQRSKLFWVNTAVGVLITCAVAAVAPAIAAFYHNDQLVWVTLGLAPIFLLNAIGAQFKVEMNIRGAWLRLAATETIPSLIGTTLAISAAMIWQTYWPLVLQQVAAAALQLLLATTLSGWRPSWPNKTAQIGDHLRFGRDTLALQTFNYASGNLDNVLVGRDFGASTLGQYNRAFQLATMPILQIASPLTRALIPVLARATDDAHFNDLLLRYQRTLTYALLAPLSIAFGCAHPLATLALGRHWQQLPQLLQILSVASAFQASGYIYYWAFLARRATAALAAIEIGSRAAMITAMIVAARHGPASVAWVVAGGQLAILVCSSSFAKRFTSANTVSLLKAATRPYLVFGTAAAAALTATAAAPATGDVAQACISLAAWALTVIAAATAIGPIRSDFHRLIPLRYRRSDNRALT